MLPTDDRSTLDSRSKQTWARRSTGPLSGALPLALLLSLLLIAGCASQQQTTQAADLDWTPTVEHPEFARGTGPLVLIDSGHGNWHTRDGRFAPFTRLLEADGYRVESSGELISLESLESADIFVIANPILGGADAEWVLPTPSAFSAAEVEALYSWVIAGGSLLLIADHMPFPGAAVQIGRVFGIEFHNGFALESPEEGGTLIFRQETGALSDHVILRGRNARETVPTLKSFTGQGFRLLGAGDPLMTLPSEWEVLLPRIAWEFDETTERISADGLLQGAALERGTGRVAVFGEAAMFTAQSISRDGKIFRFGMSDPEAEHNAQFVLNVLHWLGGRLDDS